MPQLKSRVVLNPSLNPEVFLRLRQKNKPLHKDAFRLADKVELVRLFAKLLDKGAEDFIEELDEASRGRLLELGFLVADKNTPGTSTFESRLDGRLLKLIPQASRISPELLLDRSAFRVNSGVRLQAGSTRPSDTTRLPPYNLFPQSPQLAWVEDPGSTMNFPYWLSSPELELLRKLKEKPSEIGGLSAEQFEILASAWILTTPKQDEQRLNAWQDTLAMARQSVLQNGYGIVRGVLPPLFLAALRAHYRAVRENGYMEIDASQVKNMRLVLHNDPIAFLVHRQSAEIFRKISNELIIPSYSVVSSYFSGAVLERHVDRPQCAWNVSMLVDSNIEIDRTNSWPFHIEHNGSPAEIRLEMGDGVIYRGTQNYHWRDALPANAEQTLLLFHYVPMGFQGTLD